MTKVAYIEKIGTIFIHSNGKYGFRIDVDDFKMKDLDTPFYIFNDKLFERIEFAFKIAEDTGESVLIILLKDSYINESFIDINERSLVKIRVPDEMLENIIKYAESIGKLNICVANEYIRRVDNKIVRRLKNAEETYMKIKSISDHYNSKKDSIFNVLKDSTKLELELFGKGVFDNE